MIGSLLGIFSRWSVIEDYDENKLKFQLPNEGKKSLTTTSGISVILISIILDQAFEWPIWLDWHKSLV
jgi:hypothetical protein